MGDITTFEEFDAIMTQEVETDIFENFGEPTTEEFEKIYENNHFTTFTHPNLNHYSRVHQPR